MIGIVFALNYSNILLFADDIKIFKLINIFIFILIFMMTLNSQYCKCKTISFSKIHNLTLNCNLV